VTKEPNSGRGGWSACGVLRLNNQIYAFRQTPIVCRIASNYPPPPPLLKLTGFQHPLSAALGPAVNGRAMPLPWF